MERGDKGLRNKRYDTPWSIILEFDKLYLVIQMKNKKKKKEKLSKIDVKFIIGLVMNDRRLYL